MDHDHETGRMFERAVEAAARNERRTRSLNRLFSCLPDMVPWLLALAVTGLGGALVEWAARGFPFRK